jgi:HSP20 family protein
VAKARKHRTTKQQSEQSSDQPEKTANIPFGLGGIFEGLGNLMGKLGELAEASEEFSRSGQLNDATGKLRGIYGINVKTTLGDRGQHELKVEPFGNIRRRPAGQRPGPDVREPLVDVHEEDDHVLVLAEIPGVSEKDVRLDLSDDRLTLSARRNEVRYQKELLLPGKFSPDKMRWDCKNGILRIRLLR